MSIAFVSGGTRAPETEVPKIKKEVTAVHVPKDVARGREAVRDLFSKGGMSADDYSKGLAAVHPSSRE
jgi:hypothetical protein